MAPDGSGGRGLSQGRERPAARVRRPDGQRALVPAAAAGSGQRLRVFVAGDRGRKRRAPGCDMGAGVRRRQRPAVLRLPRPGGDPLPARAGARPQRRRGHRDVPVDRHEPGRHGVPRLPGRHRNQHVPRIRRGRRAAGPLQRLPVVGAGPGRPQRRRPAARTDARELAPGRGRRDRQRAGRLAGARRRLHRPHLGTPRLRLDARHPAAGQPPERRRRAAASPGRRAGARRDRLRRGRGRVSPAARAGVGPERRADLRQHDPRGVLRPGRGLRGRPAGGRPGRSRGGRAAGGHHSARRLPRHLGRRQHVARDGRTRRCARAAAAPRRRRQRDRRRARRRGRRQRLRRPGLAGANRSCRRPGAPAGGRHPHAQREPGRHGPGRPAR